ncbi:MAG: adenylate kinase [bacterium]
MQNTCHRFIFLGAPGSGKGTQADLLSRQFGIPKISTGDIFREEIKNGSSIGKKASDYIVAGLLVPDEIVIQIVKNRLQKPDCENGFILDGFPRNVLQAKALDQNRIKIDQVLVLDVNDDVLLRRLSGRRICSQCGSMYHLSYNSPAKTNICDACGGALVIRKDDDIDTAAARIRLYHKETAPVIEYYLKHPTTKCSRINAGQHDHETPDLVAERIAKVLNQECFK